MFKFNLSEETSKIGNTAQDAVNSASQTAGQTAQQVLNQVTETGQKVIDDTCKTVQEAGEKAVQKVVTGQITALGKGFGESGEKKTEEKRIFPPKLG